LFYLLLLFTFYYAQLERIISKSVSNFLLFSLTVNGHDKNENGQIEESYIDLDKIDRLVEKSLKTRSLPMLMRRAIRRLKDALQSESNLRAAEAENYEVKISQLENSLAEKEKEAIEARKKEAAILECQKNIEEADVIVKEKLEELGNQAAEGAARIKALQEEVAKAENTAKLLRSRLLDKDKLINALTKENNAKETDLNDYRVQLGLPSSDIPEDNQAQE
jgi:chromosome segregation ATPase